jgi:hypothetical protein
MADRIRKLAAVSFVALLLTACASTTGWRALRIDASSEAAFVQSVTLLQQELPSNRRILFGYAVEDIANRSSSPEAFLGQLDGLGYGEVVDLAGPAARQKYLAHFGSAAAAPISSPPNAGFTGNTNPFGPWPGAPVGPQTPR